MGAWVVLGRKIDRFESPSGDPERPQGVPEAGRGVILSFVCVFLKNGARTSGCLHKCNHSKRTAGRIHDAVCLHCDPVHIPPGYRRKPVICCICKEGLPLNKFSMAWQKKMMTLRQYTENIGARCLDCQYPKCSFLWPEAHGVSSTQSGAEDESRARCLRLQGLQISELPWL